MKNVLFLAIVVFTSCKLSLVPSYSLPVLQQVKEAAAKTDNFYRTIENSPDKSYAAYAGKYQEILGDIINIQRADSARAKAGILLSQVQQLKTYFLSCMGSHFQKRTLNNTQLEIYRLQLAAYWKPILINETHYKP